MRGNPGSKTPRARARPARQRSTFRYATALETADGHVDHQGGRQGDLPTRTGKSVTFMAKYDHKLAGSYEPCAPGRCGTQKGEPAFVDKDDSLGIVGR